MVVVLWQNWGEYVGRQLPHFLAGATLTDITITVGPRSVRAHRIILAFFSTFFKKMLEDVCEERPMVLVFPGINFEALEIIVTYMYRGQVNVTTELLPHVIDLAKMLKVKGLIELPAQLDSMISNSNQKFDNEDGIAAQESAEMSICEDGEGLVELEVTAGEECAVSDIPTAQDKEIQEVVHTTKEHGRNFSKKHNNDKEILNTKSITNSEVESSPSIQLSTVSELSHNQLVKLSADGNIGEVSEVLFPGHFMQSTAPEEIPEDEVPLQILQEESQPKKKRKTKSIQSKYSPDDLQRALEDLWSGLGTLREIAERWGVPHSTLSVNARLSGIPVKRQLDYDNDTLEAAKEAVKAGSSYMKVARDFNIPKSVLWRKCNREGIIREIDSLKRFYYTQQDLQHARSMLMEGRGLSCIVKDKKIPKTTLFRLKEQLIREGKLPAESISRVAQPRRPSEESLKQAIQACKDDGMSQGQASEKFQVSKTTVWRRLKRLKQMNAEEGISESCRQSEASGSQENVKIEVVNDFTDSQLNEAYETISYTDDGELSYDNEGPTLKYVSEISDAETPNTTVSSYIEHGGSYNLKNSTNDGLVTVVSSRSSDVSDTRSHRQIVVTPSQVGEESTSGTSGSRFELEMPLMNLPGGGYQVVGSEIVIGGQQMVVLETSSDNQISTHDRSGDQIDQNHHLVVTSFSQMEGLESLGKVDNSDVSMDQIPTREGDEDTHT
ncbi:unnamed protein product [Meganyctiphanes norvegica]|uniref:BTB domain-containing protein n=1 Tax=Meganyctiphanes norvegica TaxID=48144 RepID=A0AAV2Q1P4_MEGNR